MSFTEYCRTRGIVGNSVKKHVREYKEFIESQRIKTLDTLNKNIEEQEVQYVKKKRFWEFWK